MENNGQRARFSLRSTVVLTSLVAASLLVGEATAAPRESVFTVPSRPGVTESAYLFGGKPPKSGPCEAFAAHGFFGIEDRAAKALMRCRLASPIRTLPRKLRRAILRTRSIMREV